MRVTRARVGFVMAWSWLCFGCHGAHFGHIGVGHIGHIGHIGSIGAPHVGSIAPHVAVAVATPRVGAISLPASDGVAPPPPPPPPPGPPPPEPTQTARCTSIAPMPESASDAIAVPTAVCGRHVIVQDAHTGMWRERR
jgi:hypothetical protein